LNNIILLGLFEINLARALVDFFETLKKAEDAAAEEAHRALEAARRAAEKQTRKGRNGRARLSGSK
jgi:hypothetical protein